MTTIDNTDHRPYATFVLEPGFIAYKITGFVGLLSQTPASSFTNKPFAPDDRLNNNDILLVLRDPSVADPGETVAKMYNPVNGALQYNQQVGIYKNQTHLFIKFSAFGDDQNSNAAIVMLLPLE